MGYTAGSFSAGQQPTTAQWNVLWANDSSFNDGTGIANLEIGSGHTSVKNDYKFSVYRNSAQNTANGNAILLCDTKTFDTGSNVDVVTNKGRFTAPVAGFYWFGGGWNANYNGAGGGGIQLFKNGSAALTGAFFDNTSNTTTLNQGVQVSGLLQLAANDYVEVNVVATAILAIGTGASNAYFHGFLVSQT